MIYSRLNYNYVKNNTNFEVNLSNSEIIYDPVERKL